MSSGDVEPVAVNRKIVLDVLRNHQVEAVTSSIDPRVTNLFKAGVPVEGQKLPEMVPKKLLHRFAHRFDIPIHHFYHPELARNPVRPPSSLPPPLVTRKD